VFQVLRERFSLDTPMKNAAAGAFAGGISVVLFQVSNLSGASTWSSTPYLWRSRML
jgi:hypothetical protein